MREKQPEDKKTNDDKMGEGLGALINALAKEEKKFDEEHGEVVLVDEFEFPMTLNGIRPKDLYVEKPRPDVGELVKVRPCTVGENKTYLGILLGDLIVGVEMFGTTKSKTLLVQGMRNPAIYIPALKKVVWGRGSYWSKVKNEDDLRNLITDSLIDKQWYVKALREMMKGEGGPTEEVHSVPFEERSLERNERLKERVVERMTGKSMLDAINDACDLPELAEVLISLYSEEEILLMSHKEKQCPECLGTGTEFDGDDNVLPCHTCNGTKTVIDEDDPFAGEIRIDEEKAIKNIDDLRVQLDKHHSGGADRPDVMPPVVSGKGGCAECNGSGFKTDGLNVSDCEACHGTGGPPLHDEKHPPATIPCPRCTESGGDPQCPMCRGNGEILNEVLTTADGLLGVKGGVVRGPSDSPVECKDEAELIEKKGLRMIVLLEEGIWLSVEDGKPCQVHSKEEATVFGSEKEILDILDEARKCPWFVGYGVFHADSASESGEIPEESDRYIVQLSRGLWIADPEMLHEGLTKTRDFALEFPTHKEASIAMRGMISENVRIIPDGRRVPCHVCLSDIFPRREIAGGFIVCLSCRSKGSVNKRLFDELGYPCFINENWEIEKVTPDTEEEDLPPCNVCQSSERPRERIHERFVICLPCQGTKAAQEKICDLLEIPELPDTRRLIVEMVCADKPNTMLLSHLSENPSLTEDRVNGQVFTGIENARAGIDEAGKHFSFDSYRILDAETLDEVYVSPTGPDRSESPSREVMAKFVKPGPEPSEDRRVVVKLLCGDTGNPLFLSRRKSDPCLDPERKKALVFVGIEKANNAIDEAGKILSFDAFKILDADTGDVISQTLKMKVDCSVCGTSEHARKVMRDDFILCVECLGTSEADQTLSEILGKPVAIDPEWNIYNPDGSPAHWE